MKLVIDVNLPPRWVEMLNAAGFEAVYWNTVGPSGASDIEIMEYAKENGCAVLTNDLDFSAILAATNGQKPSVIQIRGEDIRPETLFDSVAKALSIQTGAIEKGVVISIDSGKVRVHLLPFNLIDGK
jgi:predicted nuclease of predicted toxin-antitoxin system